MSDKLPSSEAFMAEMEAQAKRNDEVFYTNTGVRPTPEMHQQFQREVLRLMAERDPTGQKTAEEILTQEDCVVCMRKVAGLLPQ
jgi:hypothetical protein